MNIGCRQRLANDKLDSGCTTNTHDLCDLSKALTEPLSERVRRLRQPLDSMLCYQQICYQQAYRSRRPDTGLAVL